MLKQNSLLLYKNRAARLLNIDDRIEIEIMGGETARVRPKDISILHPGPIHSLAELRPVQGEIQTAWELLAGGQTNLAELADLIYGSFTPATAWAAWQQVIEGTYFEGTPEVIRARGVEEVTRRKQERDLAEANQRERKNLLERIRQGKILPEDRVYFHEVEALAFGRSERSALLRDLGRMETPASAYGLLLELGLWDLMVNPYPPRFGVVLNQPELPVPDLPQEERRDLTHLPSFAIDDESTDTPDDALAIEELPDGARLWVHIADVAALVPVDSPMDLEARARGESLHLPEGTIHLLPRTVTEKLGLGLNEVSPAFSFAMDLNDAGEVSGFSFVPSWVKVTRLTYSGAEQRIETEPFCTLERLARALRERRRLNGAVMIDFPEARIDIEAGQVRMHSLPPLRSRMIVEESMILTGIEMARFAQEHALKMPFSQQDPPDSAIDRPPQTLAQMFAVRKLLKRSRFKTTPGPHSGLGAAGYTQVTSPLRRYLDLVAHQQMRAFINGTAPLDESALLERIGATEAIIGAVRQAELASEKHWTLVYLLQHPAWRGEGILVDKRGTSGVIIIPDLAMEIRLHLHRDLPLDARIPLVINGVNLAQQEASFRVAER